MTHDAESVVEAAAAWARAQKKVALATVVETWSSSPRPVGSQMAVDQDGHFLGSVSGGCVEAAVIEASQALLSQGVPRTLEFGVTNERAWEVGLPCGGKIEIHVGPADAAVLEQVLAARAARASFGLTLDLANGARTFVSPDAVPGPLQEVWAQLTRSPEDEAARVTQVDGRRLFVQLSRPPMRLLIVGAVHLTQVLAPLARQAGFDVTIIDPRPAFANRARFPDDTLVVEWPDTALARLGVDRRTAVIALSHDAKLDEPTLSAALSSEAFYIGALGSQRTQAARRAVLAAAGFGSEALARIAGPIGLDIGARTTAEIAISIMAQVIARRRGA